MKTISILLISSGLAVGAVRTSHAATSPDAPHALLPSAPRTVVIRETETPPLIRAGRSSRRQRAPGAGQPRPVPEIMPAAVHPVLSVSAPGRAAGGWASRAVLPLQDHDFYAERTVVAAHGPMAAQRGRRLAVCHARSMLGIR